MDQLTHSGVLETPADAGVGSSSAGRDLFALTDEQILNIEPGSSGDLDRADGGVSPARDAAASSRDDAAVKPAAVEAVDGGAAKGRDAGVANSAAGAANNGGAVAPAWLAELMADAARGAEAREFWQGVEQSRQDAAAFREVFAEPGAARAAAERSRTLEEIDRAYFAGDAGERSRLAASMLREDPAAFREMVFEGLRALEEAERAGGSRAGKGATESRLASAFRRGGEAAGSRPHAGPSPTTAVSAGNDFGAAVAAPSRSTSVAGASGDGVGTGTNSGGGSTDHARQDARVAAYAAFEKLANEELERGVGGAIERTLEQALPSSGRGDNGALKARLVGAIHADVEKALQGDRQLGEQVAQVLSGKPLSNEARGQVVRLIALRAEQLVPGAAKRILGEWTQTTIAAHRERSGRGVAGSSRQDVAAAAANAGGGGGSGNDSTGLQARRGGDASGSRVDRRGVDYRRMTDDQILGM